MSHACAARHSCSSVVAAVSHRGRAALLRRFSSAARAPPVIDLSPLRDGGLSSSSPLVREVADACEQWGFFQVVNHGIDEDLCARAEEQQRAFFALPMEVKECMRRSADNSRGWYNDELTKQMRDWKEGLDFGSTPPMDWSLADADARNGTLDSSSFPGRNAPADASRNLPVGTLDGYNRFPPADLLPSFRPTMLEYYDALAGVATGLARPRGDLGIYITGRHAPKREAVNRRDSSRLGSACQPRRIELLLGPCPKLLGPFPQACPPTSSSRTCAARSTPRTCA